MGLLLFPGNTLRQAQKAPSTKSSRNDLGGARTHLACAGTHLRGPRNNLGGSEHHIRGAGHNLGNVILDFRKN